MVLLPKATKDLYKVQYKGKLSILILRGLALALLITCSSLKLHFFLKEEDEKHAA